MSVWRSIICTQNENCGARLRWWIRFTNFAIFIRISAILQPQNVSSLLHSWYSRHGHQSNLFLSVNHVMFRTRGFIEIIISIKWKIGLYPKVKQYLNYCTSEKYYVYWNIYRYCILCQIFHRNHFSFVLLFVWKFYNLSCNVMLDLRMNL